jgi:hypothetical protein
VIGLVIWLAAWELLRVLERRSSGR